MARARSDRTGYRPSSPHPAEWSHARHRFFVSSGSISQQEAIFSPEQARQMQRVLRLAPDDLVVALDNSGDEVLVRLASFSPTTVGEVIDRRTASGEPGTEVRLYQALIPREKFEWVLQKGTEVGVSAFIPVVTERSLSRAMLSQSRKERWESIVREAAEQSQRGRLPSVFQAASLEESFAHRTERVLGLFASGPDAPPLRTALDGLGPTGSTVELWIGPEGGFSEAECRNARAAGLSQVSLGPRVLRTETAGPVLAAIVLYHSGDLQPAG